MNRPDAAADQSWQREAAPFWECLEQGSVRLQYCQACGGLVYYPRVCCPLCRSDQLEWRNFEGAGTVYSFTIVHPRRADIAPYMVLVVELGPRARALVRVHPSDEPQVAIGAQVAISVAEVEGEPWLVARPCGPTAGLDEGC